MLGDSCPRDRLAREETTELVSLETSVALGLDRRTDGSSTALVVNDAQGSAVGDVLAVRKGLKYGVETKVVQNDGVRMDIVQDDGGEKVVDGSAR